MGYQRHAITQLLCVSRRQLGKICAIQPQNRCIHQRRVPDANPRTVQASIVLRAKLLATINEVAARF
jgi:hypothetical protein